MIEVIDNFLPDNVSEDILNIMTNGNGEFRWAYQPYVNSDESEEEHFQFVHFFYDRDIPQSQWFPQIYDTFAPRLQIRALKRCKSNLIPRSDKNHLHGWHIDGSDRFAKGQKTGIYYVNTTNGKTLFKNGKEIECVKNRMVIFPSELEHSSTSCTDEKVRIVINFNWY